MHMFDAFNIYEAERVLEKQSAESAVGEWGARAVEAVKLRIARAPHGYEK